MYDYTLTHDEVEELLKSRGKQNFKFKGHSFVPLKGVGKNYCKGCGLVLLRNKLTDWCVDKGCNYSDNIHYKAAIHRYTKPE